MDCRPLQHGLVSVLGNRLWSGNVPSRLGLDTHYTVSVDGSTLDSGDSWPASGGVRSMKDCVLCPAHSQWGVSFVEALSCSYAYLVRVLCTHDCLLLTQ